MFQAGCDSGVQNEVPEAEKRLMEWFAGSEWWARDSGALAVLPGRMLRVSHSSGARTPTKHKHYSVDVLAVERLIVREHPLSES